MTAQPHEPLSQAQFPAWEERQQLKHEFVNGHVYLYGASGLAGGTVEHSRIATRLIALIEPVVLPCSTHGSDMLIEMVASTRYADVVVTCDERDRLRGTRAIHFPKLIIEVLSESTADEDLNAKMREYRGIDSLEEYAMIDSRKRWAQIMRRQNGDWILTLPVAAGQLELRSVGTAFDLDELYAIAGVPA